MAERYTVTDMRDAFERARTAAKAAGVDSTYWILQEGTAIQGTMHRLFKILPGETGLTDVGFTSGNGFLGSTYRQACETLYHYAAAWYAVTDARRSE